MIKHFLGSLFLALSGPLYASSPETFVTFSGEQEQKLALSGAQNIAPETLNKIYVKIFSSLNTFQCQKVIAL